MRFANIQSLLKVIGCQLESLTLEVDEEQGKGSELVFIARTCHNLKSLRILIGDKTLMGESNLCYDLPYFRKVERLIIEGSVHLHAFVFLWGHCRALKFLKMGSVVSNNGTSTNVLVPEVFSLLLQVCVYQPIIFQRPFNFSSSHTHCNKIEFFGPKIVILKWRKNSLFWRKNSDIFSGI